MEYLFIILRTRNGNLIVFDMNLSFLGDSTLYKLRAHVIWGPKFNMDYNEETLKNNNNENQIYGNAIIIYFYHHVSL